MKKNLFALVMVSAAVIAAAVAAIKVSINRSEEAKAYAEAEAAKADAKAAEAKKARAEADIESDKRRAAEAKEKAEKDALAARKLEKETAEINAKEAADRKAIAEAEADAEDAKAEAARAVKEEAKSKADAAREEQLKAKHLAAAEASRAEAAASKLEQEKLKADKIIAEAKLLELQKIDFETLERDLSEWKLDLEERERALKPEKTITDLAWAGGMEDSIVDEHGDLKKKVKVQYDPEKDMELPETSRKLAKTERIANEKHAKRSESTRSAIVASMEKLYTDALKDGRVIDAEFYKKSILTMYPDWKLTLDVTNSASKVESAPLREAKK